MDVTTNNNPDAVASSRGILSPAEWQAIRVAGKKADLFREVLEPGEYDIDVDVRLTGRLKVGSPTEAQVLKRPDMEELLGFLLGEISPPKRNSLLLRAIREKKAGRGLVVSRETAGCVRDWISELSMVCTQKRNGPVSGDIDVERGCTVDRVV